MNWSTHSVPGSADDVTINIPANVVHSDPVSDSINSLTSTQPLTISGGTLSIAAASTTSGTLTVSGGILAGTGDITASGAFNVQGGTVDVQKGTLSLQGGGTETGAAFSIAGGATLDFAGATAFSLDSASTFSGTGSLVKDGPTTLTIPGNSPAFAGPTTVNGGTLLVNGVLAGSAVTVKGGSTLGGTGTVGTVISTGSTISPGDSPGVLNAQGNVTLDGASTFVAEVNGPTPGVGFDQLNVNGAVDLGGSTLNLMPGGALPNGESFSIIRSTAPIVGTFTGLAEGAVFVRGGHPFKITYLGGTSHDNVVVTAIGPTLAPLFLSVDHATFTAGTLGSFTVTAVGGPTPALGETGALPSGVTFVDEGDGSATLAGTPAAGTGSTYHLTITASNGQLPNATQNFTLTVNEAPDITSAGSTTFLTGVAKTFTVTTRGFPLSTLNETGALPSGVSFVDNHDGTASLTGTPSAAAAGVYDLTITAANGVGTDASQPFTLTVSQSPQAPAITSASTATFAAGQPGIFTFTSTGIPAPTLSESGVLPPGVTFVDNHDGTATLAGTPSANSAGTYYMTINASNGVGAVASQNFALNVILYAPPKVLRLQRFGVRFQPTRIVLTFNEPLRPYLAQLTTNYVFRPVIRGRVQTKPRQAIKVASAVYDPVMQTVTLRTAKRLNVNQVYQLTVNGAAPFGLVNISGVLLDGRGNGQAGTNFVISFSGKASLKGIRVSS
jgi:autotransporter-associated beta strand protein